jgi:tRNA-intron endonuclease, archaea type
MFMDHIVLTENKVRVTEKQLADRLHSKGFGEKESNATVLDLFEALYLFRKEKIAPVDLKGKNLSENDLLKRGLLRDKKFYSKFIVFSKLREAGYVVRTGLKFGFDFRVYPKGKKQGEAHTKWVVQVFGEELKFTYTELSRMVRLSGNIRAKLLLAIVDRENDVNFYGFERTVP